MATHNELGKQGEEVAKQFLIDKGYIILAENWRSGHYEIDIVAQKFDFLSIIEVKTRSSSSFGSPQESVDQKKMQNLIKAAHKYKTSHKLYDIGIRYEILALTKNGNTFDIEHLEEAFDSYTAYHSEHYFRGGYAFSLRRKW
ncbi:MAG: YraN family protein [Prevotellaceae bacterium]|jgi:putative endonuclease|nr:YraN family protein [Prevotellaceae bacterium]